VLSTYPVIGTLISGTTVTLPVTKVFLSWGVNDTQWGWPLDEATWKGQYLTIISAVHAAWPAALIYIDIPWANAYGSNYDTLATWIGTIVATAPYLAIGLDERVWFEPSIATYSDDGVHYNAAGKIAKAAAMQSALGY